MVERGIFHIEDDRLRAKGTYRVSRLHRHDNDPVLFFLDLHLINAFQLRFGNVHPIFCHFCSHRTLLDKMSRDSIIPQNDRETVRVDRAPEGCGTRLFFYCTLGI